MVDAMFHEKIAQIGKAFVECKIQTAPWVEAPGQWEEGALRWNFYDINILGDPAMSVWNDEPVEINVNYPSDILLNVTNINVSVSANNIPQNNFSCILMKNGNLIGTGITDETGNANINITEPVNEPGEAQLIISGYNCLPDTNNVMFIPTQGAYLIYSGSQINDEDGNSNGAIDNGENIVLDLNVGNVGLEQADNVVSKLSTSNQWITLIDDTENIETISAGDTITLDNAYSFAVAENIPDQENIEFILNMTSKKEEWNSTFHITANAPLLTSDNMIIFDGLDGNGVPDPGEELIIKFTVKNNGHNIVYDSKAHLLTNSPYVDIETDSVEIGNLTVNNTYTVSFSAHVSENTPPSTFIIFQLKMKTGLYLFSNEYSMTIGIIVENFETGDFNEFEWTGNGDTPWIITTDNPYEGTYCAQSGDITDSQQSDLIITLQCYDNNEISFYRKVSSEENYDYFKFFIDDVEMQSWSGEKSWEQFSYPISQGAHVLKWSYVKDYMISSGDDCAWIDNIVFPATTTIISVNENTFDKNISLYPNPNNGSFFINTNSTENPTEIIIYDIQGRQVYNKTYAPFSKNIKINLNAKTPGIYIVKIKSENETLLKKIVINHRH
jgi:hypothetical protein